jgi:hypothetical protein
MIKPKGKPSYNIYNDFGYGIQFCQNIEEQVKTLLSAKKKSERL